MITSTINPYLIFGGRCEEALAFYGHALGAKVLMVMKFNQSPQPTPPGMLAPGFEDKVMHASFVVGNSVLMASDGCAPGSNFDGFSLSLSLETEAEVDAAFAKLADGGRVIMPLAKTFWSPRFGMVADRFGLGWMVTVPGPTA